MADSTDSIYGSVALEVVKGPHAGERFDFDRPASFVVGRGKTADLRLKEDEWFSRLHFRVEVNPPQCRLMDLCSRNGTYVNGERTEMRVLDDGDVITGGRTKIVVHIDGPAWMRMVTAEIGAAKLGDAPPPEEEPEKVPDIPGYEGLVELERGGMGAVYRARRIATGEDCVVKVITPERRVDDVSMGMFLREASLLGQLQHPRIVKFIELGLVGERPFFSMEYLPTIDLKAFVETQTPKRRIRILVGLARHVLEALEYAHGQGVVHRDVKPDNILVYREEGRLYAKVADFGLAKKFDVAGFSGLTLEGDLRGTAPFMSPEQIWDSRFAEPSCDLYALGVTLYYWLSGEFPYDFDSVREGISAAMNDEFSPKPLEAYCPDLPGDLVAAVNRAIAKDWRNRFGSAKEMRLALKPFTES